jgi:hypothetical protein
VYDTELDFSFWINGIDGIRKALEAINTSDEDIIHTPILKLCKYTEPELRAFSFGHPHPKKFFLTFHIDAESKVNGFVDDLLILAHLHNNAVQVNDGVNRIKRASLPLNNLKVRNLNDSLPE